MARVTVRPLLVVALWLFPALSSAAPIILVNGSFEDGPPMDGPLCSITPSTCQDVDIVAGSTAIPGWEIFAVSAQGGAVDYVGPPWDVSDGAHAIDLDGSGALFSGITQTFQTIAGQRYEVAFDLSGNPGGALLKQVLVTVDGFSEAYFHDATGQGVESLIWQSIAFSFVASGPSAMLSFMSMTGTPSSHGAMIDNVRVAVSEPAALLLLSGGLAAGARIRRWRRTTGIVEIGQSNAAGSRVGGAD